MFRHGVTFPSRVAIVNQSTLIQDSDLGTISQALMQTVPQFCTAWNVQTVMISFVPKGKPVPNGSTCIYVLDDPDVQGAYGYHDTTGTVAYAKVFVKPIVQNGGGLLAHTSTSNVSVAQVISHELFEMLAHTICNSWWMTSNGSAFYAAEVCDPVQGNTVPVNVAGKIVDLSDYILPAWSNPESKSGPYNKLNTVKTPMTVDKNGYSIKVSAGTVSCVFGESVDQATKDKQIASMKSNKRFASMSFA
jgi:hypothetical protein